MFRRLTQPRIAAALAFVTSTALLGGAFLFQYVGGLAPCALCVYQRYPHGAAIGLAALALIVPAAARLPRAALLGLAGLALLASAAVAAFHVGVEQKWWEGLPSCVGAGNLDGNFNLDDIKKQADAGPPPRCDDVLWSLFGISMAGWNFLISTALGTVALIGAGRAARAGA